jgi:hypothetical protein
MRKEKEEREKEEKRAQGETRTGETPKEPNKEERAKRTKHTEEAADTGARAQKGTNRTEAKGKAGGTQKEGAEGRREEEDKPKGETPTTTTQKKEGPDARGKPTQMSKRAREMRGKRERPARAPSSPLKPKETAGGPGESKGKRIYRNIGRGGERKKTNPKGRPQLQPPKKRGRGRERETDTNGQKSERKERIEREACAGP